MVIPFQAMQSCSAVPEAAAQGPPALTCLMKAWQMKVSMCAGSTTRPATALAMRFISYGQQHRCR